MMMMNENDDDELMTMKWEFAIVFWKLMKHVT